MITGRWTRKDKLYAKLKQLAPEAAKVVGEEALKAANEMVVTAKAYAPFDDGDLRDSIVVTPGGQMTPAYSQPGGSQMVPENAALVTAGNSAVRYPHLVEYGTRPHINQGKFPGTQHPGTAAQPYFWPAFRMLRRRFRARMTRAINKSIKKVAAK